MDQHWLPHTAECADDLAVIRSCWTNGINHSGGVCQMNTGQPSRPTQLGLVGELRARHGERQPARVRGDDRHDRNGHQRAAKLECRIHARNAPRREAQSWSIAHPPFKFAQGVTPETRRHQLEILRQLNEQHLKSREGQSELEARIRAYELAYRMQASAPETVDLSKETEATKKLYGFGNKDTEPFGRCCLMARRLVERGVRFVQIYHGAGSKWDSHSKMEANHGRQCRQSDCLLRVC